MSSGEKIAVALSGGVDSAVAAAVLKDEGYRVIGLTMELWSDPYYKPGKKDVSPVKKTIEEAREVADKLDIPHYTVDLNRFFKEEVVNYFINEYRSGRTPNPCVICNPLVKFGKLFEKSLALGAEKMATGHYVRRIYDSSKERFILKKGKDKNKDQSYMLYGLKQAQIARTFFPLGDLEKIRVYEKAESLGLSFREKAESQEICFIPDNDYRRFLLNHGGDFPPGPILDISGKKLGEHRGLPFYTVGQRKGLGITAPDPLYVMKLNPESNSIVVGYEEDIKSNLLFATDVNFITRDILKEPREVTVRIRYRSEETPAVIYPPDKDGKTRINLKKDQWGIAPGQAVVFYHEEELLGGGIISG